MSGAADYGIQAVGRPATVTVAGTVNGGAGGAIQFDQTGAFANRLELVTGAAKSVTDPRSELGFHARQVLRDARWHLHATRPPRLGA